MKRYSFFLALLLCAIGIQAQSVSILGDSYSTFEGYVTQESGYKFCINNSYSGSTIGYQGYDGNDYSERSFITRMDDLGTPDIIFILGATNDSWAGEPVGEYKYDSWRKSDFYTFRPAMAYMLHHMTCRYPNVDIYFILNSELRDDISESCRQICGHYNVPCIELHDIDKQNGHPSVKGMRSIADQVKAAIRK